MSFLTDPFYLLLQEGPVHDQGDQSGPFHVSQGLNSSQVRLPTLVILIFSRLTLKPTITPTYIILTEDLNAP